jgi:CRISPR/Cas system-associated endonuclease/helicase Cas3
MVDQQNMGSDSGEGDESFHYHLELTPAQLKITHTALRSLLDDFGHEQHDVIAVIHEVLAKLPDAHSIRAIVLDEERSGERGTGGAPAA